MIFSVSVQVTREHKMQTELSPELAVSVSVQSPVLPAQGLSRRCLTLCRILQKPPTEIFCQNMPPITYLHTLL